MTLTTIDIAGVDHGLYLKSNLGTGLLQVKYVADEENVQVWTYSSAQSWVQRGVNIPAMFSNGDQLGARAGADGTVEVSQNRTLLATRDIAAWPYYDDGGYIILVWSFQMPKMPYWMTSAAVTMRPETIYPKPSSFPSINREKRQILRRLPSHPHHGFTDTNYN